MSIKSKSSYSQSLAKKSGKKGFTLTELLLVVVVTAILPAVTIPFVLDHYNLRASDLLKHNFLKTGFSGLLQD